MTKKIGISFTGTNFHHYWSWITSQDLGDDLELMLLSFEKNNREDIYQCDGFILTGGIDVHPGFYQGSLDYKNKPVDHELDRDYFEAEIFQYALLNNLPLLGICRGMQLVNVLQGGRLIQDLDHKNVRHRSEGTDKEHTIITDHDTLLYKVAGTSSGHVNSAHHQSIDPLALGENLRVNTYDDDEEKIIEGLEFDDKTDKPWMLCVQWHPERMFQKQQNPYSENIKQHFLTAIRKTNMKKLPIINPATEELITTLNEDTPESLLKKFDLLKSAQAAWSELPLEERIRILKQFAVLLADHIEHLAAILTSEVGKPLSQSRNEINGARSRIQWLTDHAVQYLSEEIMSRGDSMVEKIVYEPLGVICNISAWNYPYLVGINVIVPALLGGNAVMYKPSEHAVLTGLEIEKLLKEAGLPPSVFQVAIGAAEVGDNLLDLPFDGYYFTGSSKTGQYIYEKVAKKMVPCQCELGGKDPLYVADDVGDIKAVAAGTADGAFYNNGQSCCAVERIYVHEKIYESYVDEFVKEVQSWRSGAPTEDGIYFGPLSRKEQLAFLENQIKDAVSKGASILTGGKKVEGPGYFFEPTVLVDVDHTMDLMRSESFGPVIGIMKVQDDAEAIHLMQDTAYGLTASVYSADQSRAEKILHQINAGTGYWNCCDRVSAALPWSGRNRSGFGVTLSHAGLRAVTKVKGYHLRK